MPGSFDAFSPLLAQAAPAEGGGNPLISLLPFVPAVLLFYFMIIRPQQSEVRRRKEMIDTLKKNDRVLTESGIFGTVVSIDTEANKVVLRVDDERNVRMTFSRASVTRVLDTAAEKDKEKAVGTA